MKKQYMILFIFVMVFLFVPSKAYGQTIYLGYGVYQYTESPVEERIDLEVEKVFKEGKEVYRYRDRDYLIIPDQIIIDSRSFDIRDHIISNISLSEFEIVEKYDLKTMNNCSSGVQISYKGTTISKAVDIRIKDYINVPDEIIVKDMNFDIWDYMETNIYDQGNIVFMGEYDLTRSGRYELWITYGDISEKTILVVEIEEKEDKNTQESIVEEKPKESNESLNPVLPQDLKQNIGVVVPIEEVNEFSNKEVAYATEEIGEPIKEEKIKESCSRPNSSKVICKVQKEKNNLFYYISYAFYGITIILLSIIVVRKK